MEQRGMIAATASVLVTAPLALANPVDVSFEGGTVRVGTTANGVDSPSDSDAAFGSPDGSVIDVDGVSSSGLVSSFGRFEGNIFNTDGESGSTQVTFDAFIELSQDEPGGTASAGITAAFEQGRNNDRTSPILVDIGQESFFDISFFTEGQADSFFFDFVPQSDGAGFTDENTLLPGTYAFVFAASLFLDENELSDFFQFGWTLSLAGVDDGDDEPIIPLPGAAGMALLGMGVLAGRRRREA